MSVSNWEIARRIVAPDPKEETAKSKTRANTKLTALTGLLLFALLAIEGATVPFVGKLLTLHAFVGWVLLPPILLKISSTTYRFAMYYLGNPRYLEAGPPKPLLRLIGPLIVLTTTLLMWSGIELMLLGPSRAGIWRGVHKASFVIWFALMMVHVLAYFLKAGSLALPELSKKKRVHSNRTPGRNLRLTLVGGSLLLGIILGFREWHLSAPWVALFAGHLSGK